MIEVGLIGFGLAGRAFHAPVIRAVPGLHLAAILQRTGTEAAEKYPDVRIVQSLDELLSISEIHLIVIATPNETHYSFARQCLEAGRDVVVDKPFTTSLEEAVSLVQFAKDANRLLTVYQNRRYDGDFQAVRQLLGSARLDASSASKRVTTASVRNSSRAPGARPRALAAESYSTSRRT